MDLTTVSLSPALRSRLETAMRAVSSDMPKRFTTKNLSPRYATLLNRAFSAAVLPSADMDFARFNLAPPSTEETAEAVRLGGRFIELNTAMGAPAFVFEGMPTDTRLHSLALIALTMTASNQGKPRRGHLMPRVINVKLAEMDLSLHAEAAMHSEFAGHNGGYHVFVLSGDKIGPIPLPTKAGTADEVVAGAIDILWDQRDTLYRDAVPRDWNKEQVRTAVIELLKAPLWEEISFPHTDGSIGSKAMLFENPNAGSGPNAPLYGWHTGPDHVAEYEQDALAAYKPDTLTTEQKEPFLKALCSAMAASLETLKANGSEVLLDRSKALVLNDNFAIHGAAHLPREKARGKTQRSLKTAYLLSSPPPPEGALTPGANPWVSPVEYDGKITSPSQRKY